MALEIRFETESEEFRSYGTSSVLKILREIEDEIFSGSDHGVIHDNDYQVIGGWELQLPNDLSPFPSVSSKKKEN